MEKFHKLKLSSSNIRCRLYIQTKAKTKATDKVFRIQFLTNFCVINARPQKKSENCVLIEIFLLGKFY